MSRNPMVTTPNPQSQTPPNPAPKGKNYWVCRDEYPFARWYATFPARYVEPREYLDFLKEVLAAAEREEVFRITWASLASDYRKNFREQDWEYQLQPGGLTYAEYMERVFVETGKLIFQGQLISCPNYQDYHAITRLSYYETNGQFAEAEIEDIGALLLRLRPNEFPDDFPEEERYYREESLNSYKAHGSAVYFSGQQGSSLTNWTLRKAWEGIPEESRDPEAEPVAHEAYLGINLYTDIWFPWVMGMMEWTTGKQPGKLQFFDNRELAFRHTPRLNRFLQSVKQLIEARGGCLTSDCSDFYAYYGAMCSEDGILLDVELAEVVAHLERNQET